MSLSARAFQWERARCERQLPCLHRPSLVLEDHRTLQASVLHTFSFLFCGDLLIGLIGTYSMISSFTHAAIIERKVLTLVRKKHLPFGGLMSSPSVLHTGSVRCVFSDQLASYHAHQSTQQNSPFL